jgi:hypothetical protein
MKNALFWVSIAAALIGAWWVFVRRANAAPGIVAPPPGGMLDPVGAWVRDLVGSQQAQAQGIQTVEYLPPVAPTQSGGSALKGLAVQGAGVVGAAAATTACVAAGGGPLCALAAPAGKIAGQYGAQGVIYVGGKAVSGAQAVGSATVTGAKAVGSAASWVGGKLKFW